MVSPAIANRIENTLLRFSDEQLEKIAANFKREGYVILRGALGPEEMSPLIEQWQRLREPLREGKTVDGIRREQFFVHGKLPAPIGDMVLHPAVLSIAQKLLGPDVAVYLNRLNIKDVSYTSLIHLHQDMPYFHGGENKINVFLALQDTNLNNGAMVLVPRSHKLGIMERDTIDISKYPELEVIVPSLSPGDLLVADIRLWHSSVPNTKGSERVILQMLLQSADDGAYYQFNVPEPWLIAGQWRTDHFTPWQSTEGSGDAYGTATSTDVTVSEMQITSEASVAPKTASRPALKAWLKKVLPAWAKCVIIKALVLAKAIKARQGHTRIKKGIAAKSVRVLPRVFTASSGSEQVWPLKEEFIDWPNELQHTARYLKNIGKTRILLACRKPVGRDVLSSAVANGLNVKGYVQALYPSEEHFLQKGKLPVYRPEDLQHISGIDAVVVLCSLQFSSVVRLCEQFLPSNILLLPATREAVAPEPVRTATVVEWAERSSIFSYLQVSGLHGHFAEFGTFYGRAFFPSFYELQHCLQGKFYAFDSFEGLSQPDPRETAYTNGGFIKGAYGFNLASFCALVDILELPAERIVTIPGFFDKTLTPQKAKELGIGPKSISVCRIDCDLLEPTLSVLEFITPLLDDGALVYFDDWRLCRADPKVGERAAALRWLKANPSFELVEFPSVHWQHQWFIFHRNRPQ